MNAAQDSSTSGSGRRVDGCVVVVLDDRLGEVVPAAAVAALRASDSVYADTGLAEATRTSLGAPPPPAPPQLLERAAREQVVLFAPEAGTPGARVLLEAGARCIGEPAPAGVELLDAVTVMDRLRSPGGCPWDAEQTHESLRRYLVEETYEVLDALEHGDRPALREELGDLLLQVLFHARVAAEHPSEPFDVDAVAADLVSKLVSRHPHVFSGAESVHDAESQQVRWEELKQREKRRESWVDGVATGQPAVALAAKLAQRAERAGLPDDLLPHGATPGDRMFRIAADSRLAGDDPEDQLRAVARRFERAVRATETRARRAGHDTSALTPELWRKHWQGASDAGSPGPVRS